MKLKRMQDWRGLKGEAVLLRADLNVPIEGGIIQDEERIRAIVPTIQYLQKKGAVVVVCSHLGDPEGKDPTLSLEPVAVSLQRELKKPVSFISETVGEDVENAVAKLKPGEVVLLENLRFYKGEAENDHQFAKQLAALASYYVNDAFGVCHRNHASVNAIARELPAAAGLIIQKEVEVLSYLQDRPQRPFVVVMGGLKVKTKIGAIKAMLKIADTVIVGGALANTMLAAAGQDMGKSFVEKEMFSVAKSVLQDPNLILPTDVVLAKGGTVPVTELRKTDEAIDIGPNTLELARTYVQAAKTVVWNGPMGKFEDPKGAHGTREIARILGACKAKTVVGGGETLQALKEADVYEKIDYISTGGGAMLAFIEGSPLPGLEPLIA